MTTELVIVGAGGHGRELYSVIAALNATARRWNVLGFVADVPADTDSLERVGSRQLGTIEWLRGPPDSVRDGYRDVGGTTGSGGRADGDDDRRLDSGDRPRRRARRRHAGLRPRHHHHECTNRSTHACERRMRSPTRLCTRVVRSGEPGRPDQRQLHHRRRRLPRIGCDCDAGMHHWRRGSRRCRRSRP